MEDMYDALMHLAHKLHTDRLSAEFGPGGGNPNATLEEGIEYKAAQEIKRLRSWVSDLQSGMFVNCVYCGHRFGHRADTQVSMAEVLYQHIEKCPQHPMSAMKAQLEELDDPDLREYAEDLVLLRWVAEGSSEFGAWSKDPDLTIVEWRRRIGDTHIDVIVGMPRKVAQERFGSVEEDFLRILQ